ncbi:MAG: BtpA/SgcQ family protein [Saprospiraceae bacterium]|nr:BtpA/SgcQ family protein [Saprospiraceae bacterium]
MKKFKNLFPNAYTLIGCVHLRPLPGSPGFEGDLNRVYDQAVNEAIILEECGVDGIIVENFGDAPFYPDSVPAVTISSMTVAIDRIISKVSIPVGVNVLRNDAASAISIAKATDASFVRINIHMHAMLTDQGMIQGKSYETLRLRDALQSDIMILADINVKHAQSLVNPDIIQWTHDLQDRGKVDALIVSGSGTGVGVDIEELKLIYQHAAVPVIIGSGFTPGKAHSYLPLSQGAIIGSYFKESGKVTNPIDVGRVEEVIKSIGR